MNENGSIWVTIFIDLKYRGFETSSSTKLSVGNYQVLFWSKPKSQNLFPFRLIIKTDKKSDFPRTIFHCIPGILEKYTDGNPTDYL